MPKVDHNIGAFKRLVDTVKQTSSLINTDPEPDPYAQFTDYNSIRCSDNCESPNSNGVFYWGVHKWGDESNLVGI